MDKNTSFLLASGAPDRTRTYNPQLISADYYDLNQIFYFN